MRTMMMKAPLSFRPFIFILLCLILSSCAKKQVVRPPEVRAFEGPVTVEVLKGSVLFSNIDTMKSEVDVRVFKGDKKIGRFKGVFAYRFPDSMKLRVFDPFGFTAMDMLTSGTLLQVLIPQSNFLYVGKIPSLKLPPGLLYSMERGKYEYVLYAFSTGVVDPAAAKAMAGMSAEASGGGGQDLELRGKYSFRRRTLQNTGVSVYKNGERFIGMAFDDFSGKLPMFMRLSFLNGFVAEMRLKEPVINSEITPRYFEPYEHKDRRVMPIQWLYRMGEDGP